MWCCRARSVTDARIWMWWAWLSGGTFLWSHGKFTLSCRTRRSWLTPRSSRSSCGSLETTPSPSSLKWASSEDPPSNQQLPASNLQPSTLNTRSLSLFGVSVPRQLAMFSGSAACAQWRREGTANMSLFSDAWVLCSCVVCCYVVTSWSQWVFDLK